MYFTPNRNIESPIRINVIHRFYNTTDVCLCQNESIFHQPGSLLNENDDDSNKQYGDFNKQLSIVIQQCNNINQQCIIVVQQYADVNEQGDIVIQQFDNFNECSRQINENGDEISENDSQFVQHGKPTVQQTSQPNKNDRRSYVIRPVAGRNWLNPASQVPIAMHNDQQISCPTPFFHPMIPTRYPNVHGPTVPIRDLAFEGVFSLN
jgi:hypothetical protein